MGYAGDAIMVAGVIVDVASAIAEPETLGASTAGFAAGSALMEEGAELRVAAKEGSLIIGKLEDVGSVSKVRSGDFTLNLPNRGSPQANWLQNASELRYQMRSGNPIRDVSGWNFETGSFAKNTGFLRAERNLLQNRGWSFDPKTSLWSPP